MTKPFVFEKPIGFRDVLPEMVEQKAVVVQAIQEKLVAWGYQFIETPTLEYYDTVGGVSSTMEQRLFKLLDQSGRSLVLRPDMTAPIARVISSLLKDMPFPIRLAYQGNVYRAQENEAGRNAEFMELGIELVGEQTPDADAEVITLACLALAAVKVPHFKLAVGHIGFINAILAEYLEEEEKVAQLRQFLQQKNYVGYRYFVEKTQLAQEDKQALLALLDLCGGKEEIEVAKRLVKSEQARQAILELEELWAVLELHGVTEQVMLDLRLIAQRDYYTGILFEGYADRLGFPICSGGRYDHLLAQFGRPAPATGFALKIDRILEVSQLQRRKPSRILVTYTAEKRKEAFQQAETLRQQGYQVTLHFLGHQEAQKEVAEENLSIYTEHIHFS